MRKTVCMIAACAAVSFAAPCLAATLYIYDLSGKPANLATYDEEVFVATLQGVANRVRPKLFVVKDSKVDSPYIAEVQKAEGPLQGAALSKIASLDELVRTFKKEIKGVAVWDPDVPATMNVAITAAGVDDLAVVRRDTTAGSLYHRLVAADDGPRLPVILDLVGKFTGERTIPDTDLDSTGSPRCDAYLWAKARYLDTGKTGSLLLYNCDGYRAKLLELPREEQALFPAAIAALHLDYPVSQKAFAFDLSPFDDEYPKDDFRQRFGEDARTMKAILESASKQAKGGLVRVLGFPHGEIKYSSTKTGTYSAGGKHTPLELDNAYTRLLSSYNAYYTGSLQYDNPNMSVFCRLRKPDARAQNPGMSEEKLVESRCLNDGKVAERTFLTFIIGDFDSVTSIYGILLTRLWQDDTRGTLPLSWAINPELADIFPNGFRKLLDTRSKIDYFVSSASGAGVVNPGFLTDRKDSTIPDGLTAWSEHCKKHYAAMDLTITGNLVNGGAGPISEKVAQAYAKFSPTGIACREGLASAGSSSGTDYALVGSTPVMKLVNITLNSAQDLDDAADAIHGVRSEKFPNFIAVRCTMPTPGLVKSLLSKLADERPDRNYTVLDPYAFFELLRRHLLAMPRESAAPKP